MKIQYKTHVTLKNEYGYFPGIEYQTGRLVFSKDTNDCKTFECFYDLINFLKLDWYGIDIIPFCEIVNVPECYGGKRNKYENNTKKKPTK